MKSVREITRQYNKMLESHQSEANQNRVNCYVCPRCKHITKTIEVDSGVTSFLFPCEKCGAIARSTMYNDIAPSQEPTQEWYRPTLKEVLKLRSKNTAMLEHILQGGLDVRKIK